MEELDVLCLWMAELVPLFATLFSFIYGLNKFFKKGKPLFLQSITMAMGCHALGSIYHLCQTRTTDTVLEGFTPAHLDRRRLRRPLGLGYVNAQNLNAFAFEDDVNGIFVTYRGCHCLGMRCKKKTSHPGKRQCGGCGRNG